MRRRVDICLRCMGAVCHAPDGSGSGPVGKQLNVPDFKSREVQIQTDQQLQLVITNGHGKMPGYQGKIDDQRITQLVTYVRQLGAKK
jgi:cytochrome c6